MKLTSETNGGPVLAPYDRFGRSVAALGDLDGDGVTDLAVGAYRDDTGSSDRGAVYLLLLNANGTAKSSLKIASGTTSGGPTLAAFDRFGLSMAALGDLDGDGVTDLAVGAQGDRLYVKRGAVHVLFLKPLGATVSVPMDFGDAPDSGPGTAVGNYETLLSSGGPTHVITVSQTKLFLGSSVDSEGNASPNVGANGDDITTLPDDEDGLIEPAQDLVLEVGTAPRTLNWS